MLCAMDYTPLTFSSFWTTLNWGLIGIILGIVAVTAVGMFLLDSGSASKKRANAGIAVAVAGFIGLAAVAVTSVVTAIQEGGRSEEAQAQVAETLNSTFGTDITVDELGYLSGLRYPNSRPEEDFEVFGSVERDAEKAGGGFERQTIYLIWQDDELRLAESADGEVFDVLGN